MRAVVFEEFGQEPMVREVPDPAPSAAGVVVRVRATGLCRSDWHGWKGHDPITLPHVPGHELAGAIEAVGADVVNWRPGDRVTVPFACACGRCDTCAAGQQQVCGEQAVPGFTHWGSFAEYVALEQADTNLVAIPEGLSYATAASLGCRFATAFRAVVTQGRVAAGEWVAVHGCGGVGLSAVMIAAACGARVVAVDVSPQALELARKFGATQCLNASEVAAGTSPGAGVGEAVRALTAGGAHLSLDALGSATTCAASVLGLRWQGRHVQVGLLPPALGDPAVPMSRVISQELTILGSHGMAAHAYPPMLEMVRAGALRPDLLVTSIVSLDEAPAALSTMGSAPGPGMTVIEP
ncbi:zinc-dependent alcohol dehydrogenase family protein [Streptomyces mesophilus]|uniref:zinc-dependent alcohol dehydrogenase family protein n=1 Tax=Streptomyces mesophilus TaxID=1775132 RepID=UPI00333380E4